MYEGGCWLGTGLWQFVEPAQERSRIWWREQDLTWLCDQGIQLGNESGDHRARTEWEGSRLPGELDGLEGSTKWRDLINKLCIWTQPLRKLAVHGSFRVGINTKSILSKELLAAWIWEWKGGVRHLTCPGSLTRKIWHPSCPFSMQYPAGRYCSVSALITFQNTLFAKPCVLLRQFAKGQLIKILPISWVYLEEDPRLQERV